MTVMQTSMRLMKRRESSRLYRSLVARHVGELVHGEAAVTGDVVPVTIPTDNQMAPELSEPEPEPEPEAKCG